MPRLLPLLLASTVGCATVSDRVAAGTALGGGVATALTGVAVGAEGGGQLETRASVVLVGTGTALLAAGVIFALLDDASPTEL